MTLFGGKISDAFLKAGEKLQFLSKENFGNENETENVKTSKKYLRIKTVFAKASEQSFFLTLYRNAVKWILGSKFKSISSVFFTAGIVNVLSYFLKRFTDLFAGDTYCLLLGVSLIILSSVMMLNRDSIGDAIKKSNFFNVFFSAVTGIQAREIKTEKVKEHPFLCIIAGLLFGIFGVYATPFIAFLIILAVILTCIIFFKPEAGLDILIPCIIFFGAKYTSYFVVITAVSFIFKAVIGKRSITVSKSDFAVILGILLIAVKSLFTKGSGNAAIFTVCMILFYFLGKSLLKTVDSFSRLILSAAYSVSVLSILVIAGGIISLFGADSASVIGIDLSVFASRENGIITAMLMPMILGLASDSSKKNEKVPALISALLSFGGMFFMKSAGIWVIYIFGTVLFFILSNKKSLYYVFLFSLFAVTLFNVIPQKWERAFLSLTGISNVEASRTADNWKYGFGNMVKSFPWGTGFTNEGIASAAKSGSIYAAIGTVLGIFGLLLFLFLAVYFIVNCIAFSRKAVKKDLHFAVCGALCGAFALFFAGGLSSISDFYGITAMYFLFLAIPDSAKDACIREKERSVY